MLAAACTVLAIAAGVFVLHPLFREPKGNLAGELLAETELDRLLARKAIVYSNLKDLEFEYKMGRLSDGDYRRLEAGYKAEAALILQKLDNLGVESNLDSSLEKEIAARRAKRTGSGREQASATRCPACGAETLSGKKFCADCGQPLHGSREA